MWFETLFERNAISFYNSRAMPELPEVETTVRALREPLVGREITGVETDWPRHFENPSLDEAQRRLPGNSITAIDRRGKYMLFRLSGGDTLIIHLRMSGHLAVVDERTARNKHEHTIFSLSPAPDGSKQELRFRDVRKFGRINLVRDPDELLGRLGPEPLADAFTVETLRQLLQGRKRMMKSLLLDQHFLAGVGNIYADEALFYAGIRPTRRSDTLTDEEIAALHGAIRQVLLTGIEREGASIDQYLKPDGSKGDMQNALAVYGRTGLPCLNCGAPIERIVVNSRGTHFCPHCQK